VQQFCAALGLLSQPAEANPEAYEPKIAWNHQYLVQKNSIEKFIEKF